MSKIYCSKCRYVHEKGECNKEPSIIDKAIADNNNPRKTWKTYDEMNEDELKIQKFYNSKEWRRMRDKLMQECFGLCEICFKLRGLIKNATSVHHIKKLRDRFDLRLDEENLICVCDNCHRLIEDTCSSVEEIVEMVTKESDLR